MSSRSLFGSWAPVCGALFGMACVLGTSCDVLAQANQQINSLFWSLRGGNSSKQPFDYLGVCINFVEFAEVPIAGLEEAGIDVWFESVPTSAGEASPDPVDGLSVKTWSWTQGPVPGLPYIVTAYWALQYSEDGLRPSVVLDLCCGVYRAGRIPGKHWRFYPPLDAENAYSCEWTAADGSRLFLRPGRGYSVTFGSSGFGEFGPDGVVKGDFSWKMPTVDIYTNTAQGEWRFSYRCPCPATLEVYEPSVGLSEGNRMGPLTLSHGPLSVAEWEAISKSAIGYLDVTKWEKGFWIWSPSMMAASGTTGESGYTNPEVTEPALSLNRPWTTPYFSSQPMTGRILCGGGRCGVQEIYYDWTTAGTGSGQASVDNAVTTGRTLFRGMLLVSMTFTFICLVWRVLRQY